MKRLYRLNASGLKAGVSFRSDKNDIREHLHQYYDSLMDSRLADSLRIRACDSVEKLEKVLKDLEKSYGGKGPSKDPDKSKHNSKPPKDSSRKEGYTFNKTPSPGVSTPSTVGEKGSTDFDQKESVCEHCKKQGHTKDRCFQLTTCTFCKKLGHPSKFCVARARSIIDHAEKWAQGRQSNEDFKQNLNN